MKYALVLLLLYPALLLSSSPGTGPGKRIVGTWKLVSMTFKDEATGNEQNLWGENPLGFLTYTAGGRMSAVMASSSRKVSAGGADGASAEAQAELFRTCFAYAGRYTPTKDGVVHHVEVANDPAWIGGDQVRFTRLEGTRLTITAPPLRTVSNPAPMVLKLVWERVE